MNESSSEDWEPVEAPDVFASIPSFVSPGAAAADTFASAVSVAPPGASTSAFDAVDVDEA